MMLQFNLLLPEERSSQRKKTIRLLLATLIVLSVAALSGSCLFCLIQRDHYELMLQQQKDDLRVQHAELLQMQKIIMSATENDAELSGLLQLSEDISIWHQMLTDITEPTSDLLWLTQIKTAAELEWEKQQQEQPNTTKSVAAEETASVAAEGKTADAAKTTDAAKMPAANKTPEAAKTAAATETEKNYNSLMQNISDFLAIKEAAEQKQEKTEAEAKVNYLLLQGQARTANSIALFYSQLRKMTWFTEVRLLDGVMNEKSAESQSGLIEFRIWARLK